MNGFWWNLFGVLVVYIANICCQLVRFWWWSESFRGSSIIFSDSLPSADRALTSILRCVSASYRRILIKFLWRSWMWHTYQVVRFWCDPIRIWIQGSWIRIRICIQIFFCPAWLISVLDRTFLVILSLLNLSLSLVGWLWINACDHFVVFGIKGFYDVDDRPYCPPPKWVVFCCGFPSLRSVMV